MPTMTGKGFRETVTPSIIGMPSNEQDLADLTPADWDEVKRQALALLSAKTLDTPEGHLEYLRARIATATPRHV